MALSERDSGFILHCLTEWPVRTVVFSMCEYKPVCMWWLCIYYCVCKIVHHLNRQPKSNEVLSEVTKRVCLKTHRHHSAACHTHHVKVDCLIYKMLFNPKGLRMLHPTIKLKKCSVYTGRQGDLLPAAPHHLLELSLTALSCVWLNTMNATNGSKRAHF